RGDDVRSIDWRATARRHDPSGGSGQRVMVRTWRPERDRRVIILIDTGRTAAARVDDEPRIDTAFESALLLEALATRAGDRVDVMAYIEPELIEMDWGAVPAQVSSLTSQRALVVLLTSIDAPGASHGLLA